MGVQAGGAAFGDAFVKAAQLPAAEGAAVPDKEAWRLRVLATLVRKGLPAAWLPTALDLGARGSQGRGARGGARGGEAGCCGRPRRGPSCWRQRQTQIRQSPTA